MVIMAARDLFAADTSHWVIFVYGVVLVFFVSISEMAHASTPLIGVFSFLFSPH